MATQTLYPNGDVTINWDTTEPSSPTTHYTKIDEGTASPNDADYNETITLTDDDRFEFTDTPGNTNQVTQVVVHTRCGITDSSNAAYIAVSLYHSGNPGTQVGSTQNITCGPAADVPNDGTLTTVSKTWGTLTLTKTQADGLQVKYVFNNV